MSFVSDRAKVYIQTLLEEKGVSVNALAAKMGESQSTLNRAINGNVDLTLDRLYNICKALKVDMIDVIHYIDKPHSKKKRA